MKKNCFFLQGIILQKGHCSYNFRATGGIENYNLLSKTNLALSLNIKSNNSWKLSVFNETETFTFVPI